MRFTIKKPVNNVDGWKQLGKQRFIKKINEENYHVYDAVEYGFNSEYLDIFYDIVDLNYYDGEDIEDEIKSKYKNIQALKDEYPSNWKEVVVSIIVENRIEKDY